MTKKEIQYETDKAMLNRLIIDMNGRQLALAKMVTDFNRDHEKLEKQIQKHCKKYGINIDDIIRKGGEDVS